MILIKFVRQKSGRSEEALGIGNAPKTQYRSDSTRSKKTVCTEEVEAPPAPLSAPMTYDNYRGIAPTLISSSDPRQ